MPITQELTALAARLLDRSEVYLDDQALAQQISELQPDWLPAQIYDPRLAYRPGQRLFHASPALDGWFTIDDVLGDLLCVTFESGKQRTLFQNGHPQIDFPTTQTGYLLQQLAGCDLQAARCQAFHRNICARFGIEALYRLDPLDNLYGILLEGFYPRCRQKWQSDLAPAPLHEGHANRAIPGAGGLTLDECVPFFFARRPEMLRRCQEMQPDIAILQIDPEILLLPGLALSAGDARREQARFYTSLNDLGQPGLLGGEAGGACAEAWAPHFVPSTAIQAISVMDQFANDLVRRMLKRLGRRMLVRIQPELFFAEE